MSLRELFEDAMAEVPACPWEWCDHHDCESPRAKDDGPVLRCSLPDDVLDEDNEYIALRRAGGSFLAWTPTRVYFATCYDGGLSIQSAPRDPCDESLRPMGGGGW